MKPMVKTRQVTEPDQDQLNFITRCFFNNHKINDYEKTEIDSFINKLKEGHTHVLYVNDDPKAVIRQKVDNINKHLGGESFLLPGAPGKHVFTCATALILRGWQYAISNKTKYLEWDVWHSSITAHCQKLIPCLQEHIFYDSYRILFCPVQEVIDNGYDKQLESLVKVLDKEKLEIEFDYELKLK